jgi:hypothetical protein
MLLLIGKLILQKNKTISDLILQLIQLDTCYIKT